MLSEEDNSEGRPSFRGYVPHTAVKPNELEERRVQKRTEELETLYAMLPDIDEEVVEIHYDQFEGDSLRTYNFLSRGLHQYNNSLQRPVVIADRGGFAPTTYGNQEDEQALQDLVSGGGALQRREENQVEGANLPPEEREMIKNVLKEEREKKQAPKAKKKGFCG